jgi:hypothetical protein
VRLVPTVFIGAALWTACAAGCGGISADGASNGNSMAIPGDAGRDGSSRTGNGSPNGGDGGPISCSGGACPSPGDVAGFVATWKPPRAIQPGACSGALIDDYYQGCIANGGGGDCSAFGPAGDAAHQACAACLTSPFGDATWGPIVTSANVIETNEAGCIALLDPTAMDCARAVEALDECEHAACDPVCHAGSDATFDDWVRCSAAANGCGCAPELAATGCVQAIAAGTGPAAACLVGQTFQDFFEVTAAAFCGN